jgi:hypothetical protein
MQMAGKQITTAASGAMILSGRSGAAEAIPNASL